MNLTRIFHQLFPLFLRFQRDIKNIDFVLIHLIFLMKTEKSVEIISRRKRGDSQKFRQ